MQSDVFLEVPTATCTLYVPYGCKALYAATDPWNTFGNIEETIESDGLHAGINRSLDIKVTADGLAITTEKSAVSP